MNPRVVPVLAATALALLGCSAEGPGEVEHAEAVAVAEAYLDALAEVDLTGLCETYSEKSQQAAFASYDVDDCEEYEVAFIRDDTSGFRVTATMEQSFEIGEATGGDERVEVPFIATLDYVGDNDAAREFYEENPTVPGAVIVVRDADGWGVDAEATQESFHLGQT